MACDHGIKPSDLTRPGGWGAPLLRLRPVVPESVDSSARSSIAGLLQGVPGFGFHLLRRLIARHGEADEQTWRRMLMAETVSGLLVGITGYQRKSRLVEGNDDDLWRRRGAGLRGG